MLTFRLEKEAKVRVMVPDIPFDSVHNSSFQHTNLIISETVNNRASQTQQRQHFLKNTILWFSIWIFWKIMQVFL